MTWLDSWAETSFKTGVCWRIFLSHVLLIERVELVWGNRPWKCFYPPTLPTEAEPTEDPSWLAWGHRRQNHCWEAAALRAWARVEHAQTHSWQGWAEGSLTEYQEASHHTGCHSILGSTEQNQKQKNPLKTSHPHPWKHLQDPLPKMTFHPQNYLPVLVLRGLGQPKMRQQFPEIRRIHSGCPGWRLGTDLHPPSWNPKYARTLAMLDPRACWISMEQHCNHGERWLEPMVSKRQSLVWITIDLEDLQSLQLMDFSKRAL